MLEIGADPKAVHLCCVPRQGEHKYSRFYPIPEFTVYLCSVHRNTPFA